MVERLLEDAEDALHFDDKTLKSNYRLPRNRNCNQNYRDQQKRHGALTRAGRYGPKNYHDNYFHISRYR